MSDLKEQILDFIKQSYPRACEKEDLYEKFKDIEEIELEKAEEELLNEGLINEYDEQDHMNGPLYYRLSSELQVLTFIERETEKRPDIPWEYICRSLGVINSYGKNTNDILTELRRSEKIIVDEYTCVRLNKHKHLEEPIIEFLKDKMRNGRLYKGTNSDLVIDKFPSGVIAAIDSLLKKGLIKVASKDPFGYIENIKPGKKFIKEIILETLEKESPISMFAIESKVGAADAWKCSKELEEEGLVEILKSPYGGLSSIRLKTHNSKEVFSATKTKSDFTNSFQENIWKTKK